MVVDDAVVVRGLLSRWVEEEPDLSSSPRSAPGARRSTSSNAPSRTSSCWTSTCRISTASPRCRCCWRRSAILVVIMASTLTRRNAEVSLKALSLGAADYIPKPESSHGVTTSATFRHELIERSANSACARRSGGGARAQPCDSNADATSPPACTWVARERRTYRFGVHRSRIASVLIDGAACSSNRLIDRGAASADRCPVASRRRRAARACPHHPTHAADVHDHSRRAHRPRQRAAVARGDRRRTGRAGHDLRCAGWTTHAGRASRRRSVHCARRRPAGQFLQAGGRSPVLLGRQGVGTGRSWRSS